MPFTFTSIGKWWFKNIEIDLIALDEENRAATFIEAKWSNLSTVDCQRILQDLKIKAQNFRWDRKEENYAIVAKHISHKEQLRLQGLLIFDLEDFEPTSLYHSKTSTHRIVNS